MFVASDRAARVNLAVVALGTPDRLHDALDALVSHQSRQDFTVTCVVNAAGPGVAPPSRPSPEGVRTEYLDINLGWAGGLHRARQLTDAELIGWMQEDMTPEPGWLDALVAAADSHPRVGGFGSVRVGEDGAVLLFNAGHAEPADDVWRWNATDRTLEELPDEVTVFDWVTSKGFLTRAEAFDEVFGPDPRLWPLNHVDKDYCTHLRCHGWDVALVPDARLQHLGSQAARSAFRDFLSGLRDGWFNERWSPAVTELAGSTSAKVDHPCAEWCSLTDEFWRGPIVYAYQTSVLPHQVKGWARHEEKIDRYSPASGELLVLLYDARLDSRRTAPRCGSSCRPAGTARSASRSGCGTCWPTSAGRRRRS